MGRKRESRHNKPGRKRRPERGRQEGGRPERGRPEGGRPEGGRPQRSRPEGDRPARPKHKSGTGPTRYEKSRREMTPAEPVPAEKLGALLARSGFQLTDHQLDQLATYHAFLLDRNRKLNLTRILNLEDMVLKHYVDCFLVARHLPKLPEPLLDIGTGAGFPGIPLKILYPDLHIILGEGVRKRVNFLREARDEVGFEKLDIIGRNIDKDFEYPVNGTITRAVAEIRETLKRTANCLMPGGLAIFMKGPNVDDEIAEAQKKFPDLYRLEDDIAYALPNSPYQRRLVVFRKLPRGE